MRAGDAFRFRANDPHLWFVISDPQIDRDHVLLVNVTSWRKDKDQSCLLGPEDHPEIQHPSCIYFIDARVYAESHLDHLQNANKIVLCEPLRQDVLQRIREAAVTAKILRIDRRQLLFDQGLVDP